MRALWLADVLRAAGLTVHEVSGWRTRGADRWGPVRGITCHHTAGSRTSSDAGEIRVLLNGSKSAPPPIAQLYLSRSGEWWVVASGLCYHNRVGWDGPNEGYGNDALLGIEAQHSGGVEPWTDRQYDSYVRGVAALVRHDAHGWDVTVARVAGHKEHQPGSKTDPSFDMGHFRAAVALEIDEWEGDTVDAKDRTAIAQETAAALKPKLDLVHLAIQQTAQSLLTLRRQSLASDAADVDRDEALPELVVSALGDDGLVQLLRGLPADRRDAIIAAVQSA